MENLVQILCTCGTRRTADTDGDLFDVAELWIIPIKAFKVYFVEV
jgi:hypothetical protein